MRRHQDVAFRTAFLILRDAAEAEHAPWGPRDPLSVVFQDKLWIYSGKHTGGTDSWAGDIWQMTATPQTTR